MITISAFDYNESLKYLKSFEKSSIKLGLERINKLLNALSNPEKNIPFVHIAGTNGKGSTAAFLDCALANKGYFIGRFASPHLITPRERIMIDGKPVTRQWFAAASSYLCDAISNLKDKPSYFEYVTALAMHIFNFLKVDFGILEVGMGGKLDATNTVVPKISVITSISVDHSEFLGNSISSIASEKAGIIKNGVPVVTSAKGEALDIIKLKASSLSCPFYSLEEMNVKYGVENGYSTVSLEINGKKMSAKSSLKGEFQGENLALAMVSYYLLTNDTNFNCEKANWGARLETFNTTPEITIDGAHNPDAISKLMKNYNPTEKDCLVFGCMRDKEVSVVFNMLKNKFKNIILTSGEYHRFMKKEEFEKNSTFSNYHYFPIEKVGDALNSYERVLVTGSLHLVGDFLKELVKNDKYKKAIVEKEPYCYIFDDFPF